MKIPGKQDRVARAGRLTPNGPSLVFQHFRDPTVDSAVDSTGDATGNVTGDTG